MTDNWTRTKCASCGQGFLCGMELREGKCWCSDLPLIMEVPELQESPDVSGRRIELDRKKRKSETGAYCYCPSCLKKIIQTRESKEEKSRTD